MKKIVLFGICLICAICVSAQIRNDDIYKMTNLDQSRIRNEINIPGFDGYQTLKCDFHIHSVFSDGSVWPASRVDEAWKLGLDAIAITEHIEDAPSRVEGDDNTAFDLAKERGDEYGFIVIHGTEITRNKPFGHMNALFIDDANPIDVDDELDALEAALAQDAFIMWNHPGWPDELSTIYPIHEELIKAGKIHGIEVINCMEYYPRTFDWCIDFNLPPLSNSDIHGLDHVEYGDNLRPITLVFAKEKSEEGIREALFAGRTAAYFDGQLFAKEEYLRKLIRSSFELRVINQSVVEVKNISDISYAVKNGMEIAYIPGGKTARVSIPKDGELVFDNCFVGLNKKLTIAYEDWADKLVPTPAISPEKGLHSGTVKVAITGGKTSDEIYYTLDGSNPTEKSLKYEGEFELTDTTKIKAVIRRNGEFGGIRTAYLRILPENVQPNIAYKYYDNIKEYMTEIPDFSKLGKPTRSGYIHELSLDELGVEEKDQFAVILTTRLQIDKAGMYKFGLRSDDGAKLYIDGKLVVDNDGSHSAMLKSGSISLKKGLHNLKIEYFEDCEGQMIELFYESETMKKRPVPREKLKR